jgi:glycerol-3-phosphate dehydrogenase
VFPRLYDGAQAYLLQGEDRRVVFLIPFEEHYTLVGTTDVPFEGDASAPRIEQREADYLCACVNRFLQSPVRPEQAVADYSGVRALHDDGAATTAQRVSRDYRLELQDDAGPPMLSIYGGKITTYRKLAEHALDVLLPRLDIDPGESWTALKALPGGELPEGDVARFTANVIDRWPALDPALLARLARTYGTRVTTLLGAAASAADLGADLGSGLTTREVDYLVEHEWARTADDVLDRRTRLGLHGGRALQRALTAYFSTKARSIT